MKATDCRSELCVSPGGNIPVGETENLVGKEVGICVAIDFQPKIDQIANMEYKTPRLRGLDFLPVRAGNTISNPLLMSPFLGGDQGLMSAILIVSSSVVEIHRVVAGDRQALSEILSTYDYSTVQYHNRA